MTRLPRSAHATPAIVPLDRESLHRAVGLLCHRDARLADLVDRYGKPPMWARRPGFATLLRIVLEQQVTLASAAATYERLRGSIGRLTARRVADLSPGRLRKLGVTRQKAGYSLDLARRVARGALPLRGLPDLPDPAVRDALMTVRGIGPWTADIYLLMALRRPDVWPSGDLALATAVREFGYVAVPPVPDALSDLAATWRPWRSVAARILWHGYLSRRRRREKGPSSPRPGTPP